MTLMSKFTAAVQEWLSPWNKQLDYQTGKPFENKVVSVRHESNRLFITERNGKIDIQTREMYSFFPHNGFRSTGALTPLSGVNPQTIMTQVSKKAAFAYLESKFHDRDFASDTQRQAFLKWEQQLPEEDCGFSPKKRDPALTEKGYSAQIYSFFWHY